MLNLSIYDEEFNITGTIKDDSLFEVALEISGFKNGGVTALSPLAEQVMYIYERNVRRNFVELMLFVGARPGLIAEAAGMKEEVITLYTSLFFDNTLIVGQLGKTEYYEGIFEIHREGTVEYDRGAMFREAHLAGPEVILQQFNIELDNYDLIAYKDQVSKYATWTHRRAARGDIDIEEYGPIAKAADGIIATIDKATRKDDDVKKSDLEGLTEVLGQMYEAGLGISDKSVRTYDTTTEEVIEVPVLEAPKEKNEEKED